MFYSLKTCFVEKKLKSQCQDKQKNVLGSQKFFLQKLEKVKKLKRGPFDDLKKVKVQKLKVKLTEVAKGDRQYVSGVLVYLGCL